jgi:hypothetical protein
LGVSVEDMRTTHRKSGHKYRSPNLVVRFL